jgi:hypothetical protein
MSDYQQDGMVIGNRPVGSSGGATSGAANAVASLMGDTGYGNLRGDFDAVIATTKTITLSNLITGLSIAAANIVAIGMRASTGEVDWDWIWQRGSGKLKVSWTSGTLTITFAEDVLLAAGYEVAVWVEGPPRFQALASDGSPYLDARSPAYDEAGQVNRVKETNPLDTRGQPDVFFDETNMTDGTYTTAKISMDRFKFPFSHLTLDGGSGTVTLTLWATVQDGDDPDALTYLDVTNSVFAVANFTADAIAGDHLGVLKGVTYFYWQIVAATGGANDADARIDGYRLY